VEQSRTYPDTICDLAGFGKLTHLLFLPGEKVDAVHVAAFGVDGNEMGVLALKDVKRI
jgi:hypothetical protein